MLDCLGLAAAAESYLQRFKERSRFAVHWTIAFELEGISPEASTALFRGLQESLTNVVRHANARSVQVRLSSCAGRISLLVEDDGVRFDEAKAADKQ